MGKAEILKGETDGAMSLSSRTARVFTRRWMRQKTSKRMASATTVVNARFVKPLDSELLMRLAHSKQLIVTVEDAYLAGGFGSAVLELLEENGLSDRIKVVRMGVPDHIVTHGDPNLLLAKYGLDADGIYSRVVETLEAMDERQVNKKRIKAVK